MSEPHGEIGQRPERGQWVVYDPWDGATFHDTEDDALGHATDCVETFLDDTWSEDVEGLFVARLVAVPVRHVTARRSDMTPDEWAETVGRDDVDEMWDYRLEAPLTGRSEAER